LTVTVKRGYYQNQNPIACLFNLTKLNTSATFICLTFIVLAIFWTNCLTFCLTFFGWWNACISAGISEISRAQKTPTISPVLVIEGIIFKTDNYCVKS